MMGDRPQLVVMHDCERGRHKLEPRFDFAKVGDVVKRTYVCEVCTLCGHQIQRPATVMDQYEAGLLTEAEAKRRLLLLGNAG
jgi:hypothetical protein